LISFAFSCCIVRHNLMHPCAKICKKDKNPSVQSLDCVKKLLSNSLSCCRSERYTSLLFPICHIRPYPSAVLSIAQHFATSFNAMPGHVSVPNGGTSSGSTAAEKAMSNSSGPHTLPGGSSKVKMGQSASASQELSSFVFEHV